ncbi:MAG: biopolymer transporter ExbD [Gammaproteobacteria bacterium]|nr:biopolymer transporter ExbD [Gammaproteobacteria bacterium]
MGRAARMGRHHSRHKKGVALNLVSLMDIFTILVFFLLVNSSDVEVLPNAKDVQLPESIAETKARESVVILVTDEEILVQGRVVSRIDEVLASDDLIIPRLRDALVAQASRSLLSEADDIAGREATIMGDKEIPYHLLKRVMATITDADYGRLSLAVLQKTSDLQMATVAGGGG